MPLYHDSQIPCGYTVCQREDCPNAATCLHQIAYGPLLTSTELPLLHCLKPHACPDASGEYPYYRSASPVRFAKGFTNFRSQMFPQQYSAFKKALLGHYCRSEFYRIRSGERLLAPSAQQLVRQAVKEAGVTVPLDFDAFVDDIDW